MGDDVRGMGVQRHSNIWKHVQLWKYDFFVRPRFWSVRYDGGLKYFKFKKILVLSQIQVFSLLIYEHYYYAAIYCAIVLWNMASYGADRSPNYSKHLIFTIQCLWNLIQPFSSIGISAQVQDSLHQILKWMRRLQRSRRVKLRYVL